jgi:hypothetical protein
MEHSLIATLAFGFALGLQHRLDADHLVAIVTLVGRGPSLPRSAVLGALWGLGHIIVTHEHEPPATLRRPFVVGIVHGLAGSAALLLAVLGTNRLQVVVGAGAAASGLSYTWHSPLMISLRASLHL